MKALGRLTTLIVALIVAWIPAWTSATEVVTQTSSTSDSVGASALWIFANLSFAGMRAQDSPSAGWRIVAFIFGFPGTVITYFVVAEGSERAYGIELPTRR